MEISEKQIIEQFQFAMQNNELTFYLQPKCKIEDITEARERNLRFLEVLRYDSETALVIDVDSELIQYYSDKDALKQADMPTMNLEASIKRTVDLRIEKEEDKKKFIEFFNTKRMRDVYNSGVFFETLSIDFKMNNESCPVGFITYYTKWNKYNHLRVYSFVKRKQ